MPNSNRGRQSQVKRRRASSKATIMFSVRSDEKACTLALNACTGVPDDSSRAIDAALRYVHQHADASLSPVFKEHPAVFKREGDQAKNRWLLHIPDANKPGEEIAGIHALCNVDSADVDQLLRELKADPAVCDAHIPVIQQPIGPRRQHRAARQATTGQAPAAQWHVDVCHVRQAQQLLRLGDRTERIAIIDSGKPEHPAIDQWVKRFEEATSGNPSRADHCCEVAGVVSARPWPPDTQSIIGCCTAELDIYNPWLENAFDFMAYYRALGAVAQSESATVLNLSLGSQERDPTAEKLIRACLTAGVVVVAAMGDDGAAGSPSLYPAVQRDVIAVGATDRFDRHCRMSSTGPHVWISAPGERILTISGTDSSLARDGTSYATAMVSAAAWIARCVKPSLRPHQIRDLLTHAVDPRSKPQEPDQQLGYGRLDMLELAKILSA